jgi:hypothetical protein
MPAPAPKIALRKISALRPDPGNARTHDAGQIAQIRASIERFGWTSPILTDDLIRAGHGRLAAATSIYEDGGRIYMAPGDANGGTILPDKTVPIIDCTGWSEAERIAYALADNKIALNSGWDEAALRDQFTALEALDFNVDVTGFGGGDVTMILAAGSEGTDPYTEWVGMPEFDQQDKRAFRSIPLHFGSQEDVDKFAALIGQTITQQTRYVWFPETPVERYADKQYAHDQP